MTSRYLKIMLVVFFSLTKSLFGFEEPPTVSVAKPTPATIKYIDSSGNGDYISFEQADDDHSNLTSPVKYIIKSGTYSDFTWDSAGSLGNEIVFEMAESETAIIENTGNIHVINFQASFIIIDGWNGIERGLIINGESGVKDQYMLRMKDDYGAHDITVYRCILQNAVGSTSAKCAVPEGDNIRIYNNIIEGSMSVGVYVSNGDNIEIRNNIVRNNLGTGIQANPHSLDYTVDNLIIAGNLVYGNGNGGTAGTRPGISLLSNVDRLYNCYVINNYIWGNQVAGIKKEDGTSNANIGIYNNTVYGNIQRGIWFKATGEMDIQNNLVFQNGDDSYSNWDPSIFGPESSSASYNLTDNPGVESLVVTDKNFLKLTADSVAAINKGADLTSKNVSIDYFGTSRPQEASFDIGAHEYTDGTGSANEAPIGIIATPDTNVTITAGESLTFSGSGSDPDNNLPLTYLWNFGSGSGIADSTSESPGSVQFNTPGTFEVTFTATDALGVSDLSPASVTISVAEQPAADVITVTTEDEGSSGCFITGTAGNGATGRTMKVAGILLLLGAALGTIRRSKAQKNA